MSTPENAEMTLRKIFDARVDLGVRLDSDGHQMVIRHAGLNQLLATLEVYPEEDSMADGGCCNRFRLTTYNDLEHRTAVITLTEDGEVIGGWLGKPEKEPPHE